ncbi:hypothetical protein BJ165DRAFT_378401 [Panaeolus papilionaceus]|nr:hypothetical protein BJ165DRAFT_378401 [Panaeolus papilionaceus]
MNDHQRGTSRSRPSSAAFPQGSANQDANQTPGGQWYYNPPAGQVDQTKNTQPVQSSSTMIGPTSTFYNPSDNLHGREEHGPYQQWLDGFNSGAQSQSHAQATPFQSQGSYQYLPEQYAPPSSMTQYAQPMPTSMPPPPPHVPVVESGNPNPPYTQQGTDVFTGSPFYSEMLTLSNTSEASTPDHGQSYTPDSTLQSYSNSPDPAFQQLQPQQPQQPPQPTLQQQQQQHQQQQQQQAYPAPHTNKRSIRRNRLNLGKPILLILILSSNSPNSHTSSDLYLNRALYLNHRQEFDHSSDQQIPRCQLLLDSNGQTKRASRTLWPGRLPKQLLRIPNPVKRLLKPNLPFKLLERLILQLRKMLHQHQLQGKSKESEKGRKGKKLLIGRLMTQVIQRANRTMSRGWR